MFIFCQLAAFSLFGIAIPFTSRVLLICGRPPSQAQDFQCPSDYKMLFRPEVPICHSVRLTVACVGGKDSDDVTFFFLRG